MKTVSMVELRTDSERIVRELRRGEKMILSYRGEPLAELVPTSSSRKNLTPLQALLRAQEIASADNRYPEKAAAYLRELRRDQADWGERTPS